MGLLEHGSLQEAGETVPSGGSGTRWPMFEYERLALAMHSLPEPWRTLLWHAEVLGSPPSEIASALGIDPDAINASLQRARRALRAAYDQRHADAPSAP
ncbi:DNA-directed RNA polymerase specialized sigma24 family protein [Arthrobacter sp. 1088]|uniref:sigma factor-like helix-turn-helix DNA-binding protein n=1 Tax=Arthrobacter sp. 1088 TaxID=2817768 RepID=UPI0028634AF0|nr:sigma factor-like helix-turn-helix DNA-binding protein [Arthrobacter sp. 1088]MDR6688311.1 DNA-directed RNA polymerase specialized sigma24 family protein [Arthrobacter sp. 1088]